MNFNLKDRELDSLTMPCFVFTIEVTAFEEAINGDVVFAAE